MSTRSVWITGAASGIGRACARRFAEDGWLVGIADAQREGLETLRDELGHDRCHAEAVDVRDPDAVRTALARFGERSDGRLDVLFNAAGLMEIAPFEEIPRERHRELVDVNLTGVITCSHVALEMLRSGEDPHVVNMSSASAVYGTPDLASYSATKFAVAGLTEALNIEWARYGIVVCDVMPSYVNTPMIRTARHTASLDRLGINLSAEQVARVVWRAAHGRRVHWPVDPRLKLLMALKRLAPQRLQRRIVRLLTGY